MICWDDTMKKMAMIGGILAVIALILLVVAMFAMPWYNISGETNDGDQYDEDYHLDKVELKGPDDSDSTDYDDETVDKDNKIVSAFELTEIFGYIGLVGTILGIIGAFTVGFDILPKKIGALLVIIGLVIAVIAPVYLMISLPGAFDEEGGYLVSENKGPSKSFFGSKSTDTMDYSWGGAMGWYMSIGSVIALLISVIFVFESSSAYGSSQQEYHPQYQSFEENNQQRPQNNQRGQQGYQQDQHEYQEKDQRYQQGPQEYQEENEKY